MAVIDGSLPLTEEDYAALEFTKDLPRVVVANKCDKGTVKNLNADLVVSAKTGEGIDELKNLIFEKSFSAGIDLNADFLTEERHLAALKKAQAALSSATDGFSVNTADLATIDIKDAWDALGEISGETASESVIEEIFSKFSVGK